MRKNLFSKNRKAPKIKGNAKFETPEKSDLSSRVRSKCLYAAPKKRGAQAKALCYLTIPHRDLQDKIPRCGHGADFHLTGKRNNGKII